MDCIYIALSQTQWPPKHFTFLPHIHPFIHSFKHWWRCQPYKAPSSSSGAAEVRCLAHVIPNVSPTYISGAHYCSNHMFNVNPNTSDFPCGFSTGTSCDFPPKVLWISKPKSPGKMLSRMLQFSVVYLLLLFLPIPYVRDCPVVQYQS